MKKKEKLFLGGEINLSELDADVQKKYEVAKELGIYDKVLEKGFTYSRRDRKSGRNAQKKKELRGKSSFLASLRGIH